MTVISAEAQKILDEANSAVEPVSDPEIAPPPDTRVKLTGGYITPSGEIVFEAEVRELTGRDEEALAKIKDVGRWLSAVLERGTVRIGTEDVTPDILDDLLAGDWETLLIAIRAVTFGNEYDTGVTCRTCGDDYEVTVDLTSDIPIRNANPERFYTVHGKRNVYEVAMRTGAVQRKVLEQMESATVAELNTLVLFETITQIDGRPVIGKDQIRDMPMADRRTVLEEIGARQSGPDVQGVMVKCPACGAEQNLALSVAALFQR